MTRKIFRTILLVGLAALLLCAVLLCWALVRHFTGSGNSGPCGGSSPR